MSELDLTPRTSGDDGPGTPAAPGGAGTTGPGSGGRRPGAKRRGIVVGTVLVVLLAAVGFLLVKQIGDASLYYYNADEAVAKKADLGDHRFRIQGTFVGKKQDVNADTIKFTVAFNGAKVAIIHSGSEPALFKPGIPVVAEGRWAPDGKAFLSDRIEVKHSAAYVAKNPERVDPSVDPGAR